MTSDLQAAESKNIGLSGEFEQLKNTLENARKAGLASNSELEGKLLEMTRQRDCLQRELTEHESQFEGQLSQYKAKINSMLG